MHAQVTTASRDAKETKRCHTHVFPTSAVVPTRKPLGTAESSCTSAVGPSFAPSGRQKKPRKPHRESGRASSESFGSFRNRQSWGMPVFPRRLHSCAWWTWPNWPILPHPTPSPSIVASPPPSPTTWSMTQTRPPRISTLHHVACHSHL